MGHLGEPGVLLPPENFDFKSSKMTGSIFKNKKRKVSFHTFSAVSTVQKLMNICHPILKFTITTDNEITFIVVLLISTLKKKKKNSTILPGLQFTKRFINGASRRMEIITKRYSQIKVSQRLIFTVYQSL